MSQAVGPDQSQPSVSCPGCASQDGVTVLGAHQGQRLISCQRCGLVYTWPAAPLGEWSALYPATYYAHQPADWTAGRWRAVRSLVLQSHFGYPLPADVAASVPPWLASRASLLLSPLRGNWRTLPPAVQGGRLLDVGCGSGAYLARLRALGWSVYGVEPDTDACASARDRLGLDVFCGTLEDCPLPADSLDVITFWHSLEHMARPLLALQRAHDLLRTGGLAMLEVPNWGSLQRRVCSAGWFHLDLPRHQVHFTSSCLRSYLQAAGFVEIKLTSVASPVGWTGSLEARLGQRQAKVGRRPWRHNRALKALFWLPETLLGYAGQAGCLMATVRKP